MCALPIYQRQDHAADQGRRARQPEEAEEDGKTEQTEHDRGHCREIVDVDLDEVRPAVLARELLQVDGGGDADRKADQDADEERVERADAGDRKSVGEGKSVEESVELGGRRIIQKKHKISSKQ